MNEKLSQAIEDLTAWQMSHIQVHTMECNVSGQPRITFQGAAGALVKGAEIPGGFNYEIAQRFAVEPEYKEAAEALSKAIEGLHAAREAIIARKARELAALVHGDQIAGIQKLVSEIQGAEG